MPILPSNSKVLFFDVEAGGLSGHRNSILSISFTNPLTQKPLNREGLTPVESLYANPIEGRWISKWSEENVWKPIREYTTQRGIKRQSEREVLERFLAILEKQESGTVLAGWNSGYSIAPQSGAYGTGFDIPMIMSRARRYGLQDKFSKQFGRFQIRDIGQEYALRMARAAHARPDLVERNLYKQIQSYVKVANLTQASTGWTDQQIARYMSKEGYRLSGWKQEMTHKLFFPNIKAQAHFSQADVEMLQRLAFGELDFTEQMLKDWQEAALRNKLVSSAKYGPGVGESASARFANILETAKMPINAEGNALASVEKGFLDDLYRAAKESGADINQVMKGLGFGIEQARIWESRSASKLRGLIPDASLRGFADKALQLASEHKGKIGLGLGIGAAIALKPGSWFSGKDDAYNTIEGLPHGGMAQWVRKMLTDFGSGYQGNENSEKFNPVGLAAFGGSVGAGYLFSRNRKAWINEPLSQQAYIEQFTSFKYQPGDIIHSRNVLYDDSFHMAIIGPDRQVYQAYPDPTGKKGVIGRTSVEDYIQDQIKIHGKEGTKYPLVGISRDVNLTKKERQLVSQQAKNLYELFKAGEINPAYGLEGNKGLNKINCLTYIGEAYKETGKSFFHKDVGKGFFSKGSKWGVPWNVNLSGHEWLTRGPERLARNSGLGQFATGIGLASVAAGALTGDSNLALYGGATIAGAVGLKHFTSTQTSKILNLSGLVLPDAHKQAFRTIASTAAYAAIAAPLIYTGVGHLSNLDADNNNLPDFTTLGIIGGLGYTGYGVYQTFKNNTFKYDKESKRLLLLADSPKGGAQGHMTPAKATAEWLEKHGWQSDIVESWEDLGPLRKKGHKYRAFVDAGYIPQWPGGLPGVAMQWDVQGPEDLSKGAFRIHLRPFHGLGAEGMVFVTPSQATASEFSRITRQDNFYSFNTLTVRPGVLDKSQLLKQQLAEGVLELPNITKGQKYITISGGGKGFNVPETVEAIQKSGWLKSTKHKAVVFAANLQKSDPKAYKAMMKVISQDPSRYLVYDLAEGGPGRMLPQYMTAASVNVFTPGASTTVEAAISGRPFVGVYGGTAPDFTHFMEHAGYASKQYGTVTRQVGLPRPGGDLAKAGNELAEALTDVLERHGKSQVKLPSNSTFDVGKKLIDIIEQGEAKGQLYPVHFRGNLPGVFGPLAAGFRTGDLKHYLGFGLGIAAISYAAKSWFSGKDDTYNTIEGLPHGGMAQHMRRSMTDFGSGYQRKERSSDWPGYVIAGGIGAVGGYVLAYPWNAKQAGREYARLGELQKAGQHGMKMVSSNLSDASEKTFLGRLLWGEMDRTRLSQLEGFQGLAYIQAGEYPERLKPSGVKLANWGNWNAGVDKLATYRLLENRGVSHFHIPTIAASDFYGKGKLSDAGIKFLHEAGGVENLVVKRREAARGMGVWLDASKLPSDIAEEMYRNPEGFLLQQRLDLAEEFRVVTVGDKPIHSTYRFGSPRVRELAKKLGYQPMKEVVDKTKLQKSPFEVIQPVLDPKIRTGLHEFATRVSKELPYEIGALDIGLTQAGKFQLIEAQRSFGNISNPIVSRRIRNLITGKPGWVGVAAAGVGLIAGILGYNILFSGTDDEYNTIEGLRHGGMAQRMRRDMTDFGSGLIRAMFGSYKAFQQASKHVLKREIAAYARSATRLNPYQASGGLWQNFLKGFWTSAADNAGGGLSVISRFGRSKPLLIVNKSSDSYFSLFHELSEIAHAGSLLKRKGIKLPKTLYGTHISPGVIAEEALLAAKLGRTTFEQAKSIRLREFEFLRTSADRHKFITTHDPKEIHPDFEWMTPKEWKRYRKNSLKRFRKISSLYGGPEGIENYIYRTQRVYDTVEKKVLPRFQEFSSFKLTEPLNKISKKGNVFDGLQHGWWGKQRKNNVDFGSSTFLTGPFAKWARSHVLSVAMLSGITSFAPSMGNAGSRPGFINALYNKATSITRTIVPEKIGSKWFLGVGDPAFYNPDALHSPVYRNLGIRPEVKSTWPEMIEAAKRSGQKNIFIEAHGVEGTAFALEGKKGVDVASAAWIGKELPAKDGYRVIIDACNAKSSLRTNRGFKVTDVVNLRKQAKRLGYHINNIHDVVGYTAKNIFVSERLGLSAGIELAEFSRSTRLPIGSQNYINPLLLEAMAGEANITNIPTKAWAASEAPMWGTWERGLQEEGALTGKSISKLESVYDKLAEQQAPYTRTVTEYVQVTKSVPSSTLTANQGVIKLPKAIQKRKFSISKLWNKIISGTGSGDPPLQPRKPFATGSTPPPRKPEVLAPKLPVAVAPPRPPQDSVVKFRTQPALKSNNNTTLRRLAGIESYQRQTLQLERSLEQRFNQALGFNVREAPQRLAQFEAARMSVAPGPQIATNKIPPAAPVTVPHVKPVKASAVLTKPVQKIAPKTTSIFAHMSAAQKIGVLGAVGLGALVLGGLLFSGKDDSYNTIEGLRHGGMAAQRRREMTDFGSGARALFGGSMKALLAASSTQAKRAAGKYLKTLNVVNLSTKSAARAGIRSINKLGSLHVSKKSLTDWLNYVKPGAGNQRWAEITKRINKFRTNITDKTQGLLKFDKYSLVKRDIAKLNQRIGSPVLPSNRDLAPVVFSHEVFEAHHGRRLAAAGHLDIQTNPKTGMAITDLWGNLLRPKTSFGSHVSSAVIADEMLISAAMGPKYYRAQKLLRQGELAPIRQELARIQRGEVFEARFVTNTDELNRFTDYVRRVDKMTESFERKWLHRFQGFDQRTIKRINKTVNKVYGKFEGMPKRGFAPRIRKFFGFEPGHSVNLEKMVRFGREVFSTIKNKIASSFSRSKVIQNPLLRAAWGAEDAYKKLVLDTLSKNKAFRGMGVHFQTNIQRHPGFVTMDMQVHSAAGQRLFRLERSFYKDKVKIDFTGVDPSLQGKGLGKTLSIKENRIGKELGYKHRSTVIETNAMNPVTARWGLKFGGQIVGDAPQNVIQNILNKQISIAPGAVNLRLQIPYRSSLGYLGENIKFETRQALNKIRQKLFGANRAPNTISGMRHASDSPLGGHLKSTNKKTHTELNRKKHNFGSSSIGEAVAKFAGKLYRGTKSARLVHSPVFSKTTKSVAQDTIETVLERVRVAQFPHRPSRAAATYWSPNPEVAARYAGPMGSGGHVSSISAAEDTFFTREDWVTDMVKLVQTSNPDKKKLLLEKAQQYWKGVDPTKIKGTKEWEHVEALVPGQQTAERIWSVERSRKGHTWKNVKRHDGAIASVPHSNTTQKLNTAHKDGMIRTSINARGGGRRHLGQAGKIVR